MRVSIYFTTVVLFTALSLPVAAQLPDLTPVSVTIDEDAAYPGDSVRVRTVVTNAGDGSSCTFYIHTYLTTEYEWDPDDPNNVHLGGGIYGPLAPGDTHTYTIANAVPAGTPAGSYYACAFVDYYDDNAESNENNNLGLSDDVVLVQDGSTGSIEIMTWVAPYAIEECQAVVEADFGECDAEDGLTRVGLQFWIPDWDGTIAYQNLGPWGNPDDADVIWWRDWCTANGIECLLCIYNNDGSTWNWDLARAGFVDNRTTFVAALVAEMERLNLDGIDLDLEGIGNLNGDRAAYDQFVHDLWVELDARGKTLTIDSFHYIWNAPNQDWWSDWLGEVDNIHSMGYDDLYEGGTGYQKYSFQQNAGYTAGYAGNVVLMGMPSWLASWGVSAGYGTSAQAHVQEVRYSIAEPTGIAIWDLQLDAWQDSDLWCEIVALRGSDPATGVEGGVSPATCMLLRNRPNPFNPATLFTYTLPQECYVELVIYDVRGRKVATLVNEHQSSGSKMVTWDAAGLASGIYFCRLTAGGEVTTRRAVLVK